MGRRLVYPLECTAHGIVPVFVLVFVDSVAVQATVLRRGFVMGDTFGDVHNAPDVILALMREHHDGERLSRLPQGDFHAEFKSPLTEQRHPAMRALCRS